MRPDAKIAEIAIVTSLGTMFDFGLPFVTYATAGSIEVKAVRNRPSPIEPAMKAWKAVAAAMNGLVRRPLPSSTSGKRPSNASMAWAPKAASLGFSFTKDHTRLFP